MFKNNHNNDSVDQKNNTQQFSPHQLTSQVKLLHKVAIRADEKVLILKRSDRSFSRPSMWDLPGGNSEWPKQITQPTINLHQQDIIREVEEETGLDVSSTQFNEQNLVYFATYFEPEQQVYSINCGWVVVINPELVSTVKISSEHTDFAWISLSDLSLYDFGGLQRDYETKIIRQVLTNNQ